MVTLCGLAVRFEQTIVAGELDGEIDGEALGIGVPVGLHDVPQVAAVIATGACGPFVQDKVVVPLQAQVHCSQVAVVAVAVHAYLEVPPQLVFVVPVPAMQVGFAVGTGAGADLQVSYVPELTWHP